MRSIPALRLNLLAIIILALASCTNKTEDFISDKLSDYLPLQPGKYITYRLDSLVFTNFGTVTVTRRYQVKHQVDAQITDNQGRPSYRVYVYIRDSAGTEAWTPNGTYFITPLATQSEVIEDNFRVVKLHLPVKQGYKWPGNTYLPDEPYFPAYDFSNDYGMKNWDFTFKGVNETIILNQQTINNVITVEQVNDPDLPDTINVVNNQITAPDKTNTIWVRGNATDTININTQSNTVDRKLSLNNTSNYALVLNNIYTPPGYRRDYEYNGTGWDFGSGKDTLFVCSPQYCSLTLGVEKYAKGIGMVYKNYILWEFQPNPNGHKTGFGITLWMIDHN